MQHPNLTIELHPKHAGAPAGSLCARLLNAGFKVRLDLLPEDQEPEDAYQFPEHAEAVRTKMARGDPWAWFIARVTVTDPASGMSGDDILGGCGAYDEPSWFHPTGNMPDMVAEALSDLKAQAGRGATLAARLEGF